MICFYLAEKKDDYAAAKLLFSQYAASIMINLDFQHFEDELNGLEKIYTKPFGGIILAKEKDEIMGCIAVRKFSEDVGELKRMFLKPQYQSKGIGKDLLNGAIQLAKECKYTVLRLDTLNYMFPAIRLYKQAGFYEIPPYYYNPITTAIYFEKLL